MRMILALAAAMMMASCTAPNMTGVAPGVAEDTPRTPPAFRKPPPQFNHWGAGVGYGGRY